MNSLVIGMGQVGSAVTEVTDSRYSYDTATQKSRLNVPQIIGELDVLHICFPYTEDFVKEVQRYIRDWQPKHIIVWSTVPIGTCRQIDERVVHSPVEGVHPHLAESIRTMRRFIGYNRGAEGRFFADYFLGMGMSVEMVSRTETTELLKLRSTAKYGVNIAWAQYEVELCKKFGVEYSDLMSFDRAYNDLYRQLGDQRTGRYVLFPPDGEIGGHCVVPNAKLLKEQFPEASLFLDKIIAMEKKQ